MAGLDGIEPGFEGEALRVIRNGTTRVSILNNGDVIVHTGDVYVRSKNVIIEQLDLDIKKGDALVREGDVRIFVGECRVQGDVIVHGKLQVHKLS